MKSHLPKIVSRDPEQNKMNKSDVKTLGRGKLSTLN